MFDSVVTEPQKFFSKFLNRSVELTLLRPATLSSVPLSVLLVFDGQDFPALNASKALSQFLSNHPDHPLLLVGIHANKDRIFEYGTASQADYAQRGNKASHTTAFVISELIPYLKQNFPVSSDRLRWAVAGFSLGGLMAFDLAWHHAEYFSKVGVFSGALWWRQKALSDDYHDSDRIMHKLIRQSDFTPKLSFWLQIGTHDETDDRDGDGVIDSIDDTLDLIAELERKRYRWGKEIKYVEVAGGEHNPKTWARVFPSLLCWMFKKQ